MPRKKVEEATGGDSTLNIMAEEGIDQYDLPRAAILKLARQKLPDNVIIRKDAHTALIKACPVFINYVVAMAHELAVNSKGGARKKINAQDVIDAVEQLEFPKGMGRELQKQLDAYRDLKAEGPKKKPQKAQAIVADKEAKGLTAEIDRGEEGGEEDNDEEEEEGDAEDAEDANSEDDDDEGAMEIDAQEDIATGVES